MCENSTLLEFMQSKIKHFIFIVDNWINKCNERCYVCYGILTLNFWIGFQCVIWWLGQLCTNIIYLHNLVKFLSFWMPYLFFKSDGFRVLTFFVAKSLLVRVIQQKGSDKFIICNLWFVFIKGFIIIIVYLNDRPKTCIAIDKNKHGFDLSWVFFFVQNG